MAAKCSLPLSQRVLDKTTGVASLSKQPRLRAGTNHRLACGSIASNQEELRGKKGRDGSVEAGGTLERRGFPLHARREDSSDIYE